MNNDKKFNKIWRWIIDFKKNCENSKSKSELITKILVKCAANQTAQQDFFNDKYLFPSTETENIANELLNFSQVEFTLCELFECIVKNSNVIKENNIDNIFLLIYDIMLYKTYQLIKIQPHGSFFSQLNCCIVLDSMKIKPKEVENIYDNLLEVNSKANTIIDDLNKDTVWAIAMLNYKMHVYDVTISFFDRFLVLTKDEANDEIFIKRIHAEIYMGYCYEKAANNIKLPQNINYFSKAIEIFSNLLNSLDGNDKIDPRIIMELHHGLGHFYNERAVFGESKEKDADIIKARAHMKEVLKRKPDYYSCYGSLFHEYGDYETAQTIFEEASLCEEIQNNDELKSEMKFYEAQTNSSILNDSEKQNEDAKTKFISFENYCKATFNYDGIVHARIFKIRTCLRRINYGIKKKNKRTKLIENINKWYNELSEYTLSNYASESIKNEYKKIKLTLEVFRTLYADEKFIWHKEDLQHYLHRYTDLVPRNLQILDYIEETPPNKSKNLYQVSINNLMVWCISGKNLSDILKSQECIQAYEKCNLNITDIISISDIGKAHNCINENGYPDIIVLIPPMGQEKSFEKEVETIIDFVSESYFCFCPNDIYNKEWLTEKIQEKKSTLCCCNTIVDTLRQTFCYRALEIMRKELLLPIPLFSLAPTHFSSSYDFQLGEDISIQPDYLNENKKEAEQNQLLKPLNFIDSKYSSSISNSVYVKNAVNDLTKFKEKNCFSGVLTICFRSPNSGFLKKDNYISYCISDKIAFPKDMFIHNIIENKIYTVKALPTYIKSFWNLTSILNDYAEECEKCENCEDCTVCNENGIDNNSDVSKYCQEIISVIFSQNNINIDYPYKCIHKKIASTEKETEIVYLVFYKVGINYIETSQEKNANKTSSETNPKTLIETETSKKMPTSVFVTYAWEPEGSEFEKYQEEVYDFTLKLRENNFDASFDLAETSNNWNRIMIEGLQKDKIVVLLSKEYKRKADKAIGTGVAFESNAIVDLLKTDPEKVILAKLPSQAKYKISEIKPVAFPGENVIDLSKTNKTNGFNLLYSLLKGEPIAYLPPVSGKSPEIETFGKKKIK